jgi:S-methylmethionine-dependent homocysteine/selenocysteine methylase
MAHVRYIDAGCTVVTTNSFTATPYHFKRAGVTAEYLAVVQVRTSQAYFLSNLPSLCCLAFCKGALDSQGSSNTMAWYADRQQEDAHKKQKHPGQPRALSR